MVHDLTACVCVCVCVCEDNIAERSRNINDYFTYSLYCNVCRSLFEKHKLLFAVLLAARILQATGDIGMVRASMWLCSWLLPPVYIHSLLFIQPRWQVTKGKRSPYSIGEQRHDGCELFA